MYNSGCERGRQFQDSGLFRAPFIDASGAVSYRMRRKNIEDIIHDASGAGRFKMRREIIQDTIHDASDTR